MTTSAADRPADACTIRSATNRDVPVLVELLCGLFAIETDFAISPPRHARGLRMLLREARRGRSLVLVATVQGRVVGMATVQIVISTAEGARSGWIEDVIVAPELRRKGLGARLMAAIGTWARRRGVRRLQLLADQRNQAALAFYHRLGYARTNLAALRARHPGEVPHAKEG